MNKEILLGVNIDHVATLRQSRLTSYPDPVQAAMDAEQAGADGITLHLREDRRHIQERDVEILRGLLQTRMNLEMAVTEEMIAFAERIRPHAVCLVPEAGSMCSGRRSACARPVSVWPRRAARCRCSSMPSASRSKPRHAWVRLS
jgi:hypothetical protein